MELATAVLSRQDGVENSWPFFTSLDFRVLLFSLFWLSGNNLIFFISIFILILKKPRGGDMLTDWKRKLLLIKIILSLRLK